LYQERDSWWVGFLLLMPDHLHALLSFPREKEMSKVVGNWKRYHARQNGVCWQDGYFDHRIRADGDGVQSTEKANPGASFAVRLRLKPGRVRAPS
jgi:REP element-mobilizing transposase RayT